VVAGCGVIPGAAQAAATNPTTSGTFSCRASALRVSTLINLEPFVANAQQTPCVAASSGLLPQTTIGPVTVSVLTAKTSTMPNKSASAAASVAKVRITLTPLGLLPLGITVIDAEILSTTADVSCVNGYPAINSSSTIAKLAINGQPVLNLNQTAVIPLVLANVYLNEYVQGYNSVTRRALRVSVLGQLLEVVVAESTAGFTGNPCVVVPPPHQCNDGIDNDHDGKVDFGQDPGCDNADDDDESNPPACSDGKDNDGDGKVDFGKDPGCDNAGDDDESNPPACSDGKDNDGDGKVDYAGKDPGCMNAGDDEEADGKPACSDGNDNDSDAKRDYPADPGCTSAKDNDERG
jgi:hypothetical protein